MLGNNAALRVASTATANVMHLQLGAVQLRKTRQLWIICCITSRIMNNNNEALSMQSCFMCRTRYYQWNSVLGADWTMEWHCKHVECGWGMLWLLRWSWHDLTSGSGRRDVKQSPSTAYGFCITTTIIAIIRAVFRDIARHIESKPY